MNREQYRLVITLFARGFALGCFFALPGILNAANPGWFQCVSPFGGVGLTCLVSFLVGLSFVIPSLKEGHLRGVLVGVFVLIFALGFFALLLAWLASDDYCGYELAYPRRNPGGTLLFLWLGSGVSVILDCLFWRGKARA